MPLYICFDGGGTKTCAVEFDESLRLLAHGRSGGVNTNFTTLEDCRKNTCECLAMLLKGLPGKHVDKVWATFVGPAGILRESLADMVSFGELELLDEGYAGLLAGALQRHGFVALSGTGSDIFSRSTDGTRDMLGGMGALLGDQGSGAWIGQKALRAAVASIEGWGSPTILKDLVLERWELKDKWELAKYIYQTDAPVRRMASAVPIAAEAANRGDVVALGIFSEAGRMMAVQTLQLIRRNQNRGENDTCVCCGGAWKAHPAMYERFSTEMRSGAPHIQVRKPWFEHLMAGAALYLLESRPDIGTEEARRMLCESFPMYQINW